MKRRPDPTPPQHDPRLLRDPQVKRWAKRMAGSESVPVTGDQARLWAIARLALGRRVNGQLDTQFLSAMQRTTPKLAVPEREGLGDLRLCFALPEMQEFWANWNREPSRRGPTASCGGSKAALTVFGMGRVSYLRDAAFALQDASELRCTFESLERLGNGKASTAAPGIGHKPGQITVPAYSTIAGHLKGLAKPAITEATRVRLQLIRSLREDYPEVFGDVGRRLIVDGTHFPAWCPQVGSGDPEREEKLRFRVPDAGYRAYWRENGPGGKRAIESGDSAKAGAQRNKVRSWRGWYLVAIIDQATGLPLVHELCDAAQFSEREMLVPLLSTLYRLWPDIGAELIAGDSHYNVDESCRLCEMDYGIHPVFRIHGKQTTRKLRDGAHRDNLITRMRHTGQLFCDKDNVAMDFATFDRPSQPGRQVTDPQEREALEGRFRTRHTCPSCQTRYGLRASVDWSALTYYPHHPHGRPDLYAMRQAMLARTGQVESYFSALKTGYRVGTGGPDRTKLFDSTKFHALVELAALGHTALAVFDQRERRGNHGINAVTSTSATSSALAATAA